jgi:hypothetical protein
MTNLPYRQSEASAERGTSDQEAFASAEAAVNHRIYGEGGQPSVNRVSVERRTRVKEERRGCSLEGEGIPLGRQKLNTVVEQKTCCLGQNSRPGKDGDQGQIGPWTAAAHPARPITRDGPMHRTGLARVELVNGRLLGSAGLCYA